MFKVGDRVVFIMDGYSKISKDSKGTVKHLLSNDNSIGIEWDEMVYGHDLLNHTGKNGYCWYVEKNEIKLLDNSLLNDEPIKLGVI